MPQLTMPPDFPSEDHDALMSLGRRLETAYREQNYGSSNPNWGAFVGALNGITYRWRAIEEAERSFNECLSRPNPTIEGRCREETALFAFFTNGLSVLELIYFALYALAALLKPTKFHLICTKPKQITPERVTEAFEASWPTEPIAAELSQTLHGDTFVRVKTIRHILSHRGTPPINFAFEFSSSPGESVPTPATWSGFKLDAALLPNLRADLAKEVRTLLGVGRAFGTQQIANVLP
jgi:hypothetical protein